MQSHYIKSFLIFIVLWYFLSLSTSGQSFHDLSQSPSKETYSFAIADYSTDSVKYFANQRLNELHKLGFLKAEKENITNDSINHYVTIKKGPEFYYHLNSTIDPQLLYILRIDRYFNDRAVSFPEFDALSQTIFKHFENNGYPFARLLKTDVRITDSIIEATIVLERMEYVVFDTLSRDGNIQISQYFLENHLGIIPGQPYNEKLVQEAGNRLVSWTSLS